MINIKAHLAAAALVLSTAVPASAAPIFLDFFFDGRSGTLFGLDDEVVGSQFANRLHYNGVLDMYFPALRSPPGFPPCCPVEPVINEFQFVDGALVLARFVFDRAVAGAERTQEGIGDPNNFLSGLELTIDSATSTEVIFDGPFRPFRGAFIQSPTVSYIIRPVAPVPLPAGGLLLLTGLVGMAAVRRRKDRAA